MRVKPYYEENGIQIFHGDCRDVLPSLPRTDLVLTDPPYGINAARDRNSQRWGWNDYPAGGWDTERPTKETLDMLLLAGKRAIIWGGNYFADMLPASSKWLIWDKGQTDFSLADAELAWCSWDGAVRRKLLSRARALQEGKHHATQSPLRFSNGA